jgi:carnitine 3-dehydrogenase
LALQSTSLGCGTIGAGWVARLVLHGWRVQAHDANPAALQVVQTTLKQARVAFAALHPIAPVEGELMFFQNQTESLANATVVIESLPEDLLLKQRVYQAIERDISPECLLLSSTSGFKPSDLASALAHPERFLVCHPFNPVYLLPLVEVVPHPLCSEATRAICLSALASADMRPLLVRTEIDGHIADRLLEAMWREALWLVHDNIATTAEIDDAIKYGFGLRMAHMGLFETYRLGGGVGGFEAFLAQFGPALQWPWSHLTDVPDLDAALVQKIVAQSDEQTGNVPHEQRLQDRDAKLVAILKAVGS